MNTEEVRMTLSIIEMKNFKALITPKSIKIEPFITKVKDFDYSEDATKVILSGCEETTYPDGTKNGFIMYLKDIKTVEKYT